MKQKLFPVNKISHSQNNCIGKGVEYSFTLVYYKKKEYKKKLLFTLMEKFAMMRTHF